MYASLVRWWDSITLRTKITGVTVVVLAFGLMIVGAGTVVILKQALIEQTKAELVTFSSGDVTKYIDVGEDGEKTTVRETSEYYIALYSLDGTLVDHNWDGRSAASLPNLTASASTLSAVSTTRPSAVYSATGTEYQTMTVAVDAIDAHGTDGILLIAVSMRGTDNVIATYTAIYLGLGIGVIVLGALLTRVLVTNTLQPLRRVEVIAARIADGDFGQRLEAATPNTEVGRLTRSLNTMLGRIDSAFRDRAETIKQMRRFVGDASHELRTPLVTVRGYAELYRMGAIQKPEDVAQAMERIEKEALRMGVLVEDLLQLARLDEARPLQLERVDLTPLAKDAVMDARAAYPGRAIGFVIDEPPSHPEPPLPAETEDQAAPAKTRAPGGPGATGPIALAGATLARLRRRPRRGDTGPVPRAFSPVTEMPESLPEVPAIVMAEENKIRQVIANLMGNAKRFTPDGSPIEIGVSADARSRTATVAIIDHGDGVPPQIREKIFQRFWRADTSRARETGGSGLGLAIVSSIVAAHGGEVDVSETPGGGATFRVTLPLADPVVPSDTGDVAVHAEDAEDHSPSTSA